MDQNAYNRANVANLDSSIAAIYELLEAGNTEKVMISLSVFIEKRNVRLSKYNIATDLE